MRRYSLILILCLATLFSCQRAEVISESFIDDAIQGLVHIQDRSGTWGFSIELNLLNIPSNMFDWANTLNAKELLIKPQSLKYGAVYLAGELDGQWGGMTIIKN